MLQQNRKHLHMPGYDSMMSKDQKMAWPWHKFHTYFQFWMQHTVNLASLRKIPIHCTYLLLMKKLTIDYLTSYHLFCQYIASQCHNQQDQSSTNQTSHPFAISYAVQLMATEGACNATLGSVPRNKPLGPSSWRIDWKASSGVV